MELSNITGEATFPENYKGFIGTSKYSRWREDLGRREVWSETVDRYTSFIFKKVEGRHDVTIPEHIKEKIHGEILNQEVLPSMRGLMTAGEALERDEIACYNCSYITMDDVRAFDEIIYILMCGAGVGYSVERVYTNKLPSIPEVLEHSDYTIVVEDSKTGWAHAFRELIESLYEGFIPDYDTVLVRPAGSRLKVFGGRASGPEPLERLFNFTIQTFKKATGRQLAPEEVSDIVCHEGDAVVSGGVRRSALICLTDLFDRAMSYYKSGQWYKTASHRAMANISAVYEGDISREVFFKEWETLKNSGSGERGIFNRDAAKRQAFRTNRRDIDVDYGCNPCSEVLLRPQGLCNLSTIVVRGTDSRERLIEKIILAAILGTLQSTLTNFRYLRDIWRQNAEEERLLGVSMTGTFGHTILSGQEGIENLKELLSDLREVVKQTNRGWASFLDIPAAKATTCIKPEGTTSQLVGVSSGLHPWYAPYFIRTVRGNNDDALTKFMKDKGIPYEDDLMAPNTTVFSFPVKAPEGALYTKDLTAIDHLELWKAYQDHYCEHKPSVTINVQDHEWDEVGEWVYDHIDEISGTAFLPYSDHEFKQPPYQEVSEGEYLRLVENFPSDIDWTELGEYESQDNTTGSQTLACSGSSCEVVDISEIKRK